MLGRARLSGPAVPLLGVAVGLLAAGAVTLFQDSIYRADASIVLVRQGQPPGNDPQLTRAAQAAAQLFDSRAVAESAIRNLGLDEQPAALLDRVHVDAQRESSLVRIVVEAPSTEEARRAAQEVSEVATVLYNDRFGPETVASIWEAASAREDRISPDPVRNLALGAVLGALIGLALVLASLRREDAAAPAAPPPRVGAAARPLQTPPEPVSGPFVLPGPGRWTVGDVERLLAEHGSAFPEQHEELQHYLDTFRGVAGPDGRLPGGVDLVIEDVFADLIAHSRG